MPISAPQLFAYLAQEKKDAKMPEAVLSPMQSHAPQKADDVNPPSFDMSPISSFSIASSPSQRTANNNGQLFIASLTSFSKYFHPRHGLYRNHPENDLTGEVLDDGLPVISAEDVEWLIVDLRYIIADDEWEEIDQQVSPQVS
jgi:hypothetical protein